MNVQRQRIQAEIGHNETFKLEMSKRIIDAKIRNQVVVLRRYARGRDEDIHRMIIEMQNMQKNCHMRRVWNRLWDMRERQQKYILKYWGN